MMNRGKITLILLGVLIAVLLISVLYKKDFLSSNRIVNDKQMIKTELIESFNNNEHYFTVIAKCAKKTEGSFNASIKDGELTIQHLMVDNNNIIEDKEIVEAVEIIINSSYIVEIGEDDNAIWFSTKKTEEVHQGLFYKKKDVDLTFLDQVEEIRENWYYYSMIIEKI